MKFSAQGRPNHYPIIFKVGFYKKLGFSPLFWGKYGFLSLSPMFLEDVTWRARNLLALRNHVILIYYNREVVESSIDRARTTLRHQAAGVSGSWSDTCRFRRRQFWGVPHSSDLGPATDSCLLSLEVGTFGLSSSSL